MTRWPASRDGRSDAVARDHVQPAPISKAIGDKFPHAIRATRIVPHVHNETVRLIERGHDEQDINLPLADLPRALKSIFKTEFPRSRKVRVYHISGPEAVGREIKRL